VDRRSLPSQCLAFGFTTYGQIEDLKLLGEFPQGGSEGWACDVGLRGDPDTVSNTGVLPDAPRRGGAGRQCVAPDEKRQADNDNQRRRTRADEQYDMMVISLGLSVLFVAAMWIFGG
jgi:hypothetical protein